MPRHMAVVCFAMCGLPQQQGEGQIMSGGLEAVINRVLTKSTSWLQSYSFGNSVGNAEHALKSTQNVMSAGLEECWRRHCSASGRG